MPPVTKLRSGDPVAVVGAHRTYKTYVVKVGKRSIRTADDRIWTIRGEPYGPCQDDASRIEAWTAGHMDAMKQRFCR